MHAYLAEDLIYDPLSPDEGEDITMELMSYEDTMNLIRAGGLNDAKSLAALMLYKSKFEVLD